MCFYCLLKHIGLLSFVLQFFVVVFSGVACTGGNRKFCQMLLQCPPPANQKRTELRTKHPKNGLSYAKIRMKVKTIESRVF